MLVRPITFHAAEGGGTAGTGVVREVFAAECAGFCGCVGFFAGLAGLGELDCLEVGEHCGRSVG